MIEINMFTLFKLLVLVGFTKTHCFQILLLYLLAFALIWDMRRFHCFHCIYSLNERGTVIIILLLITMDELKLK